MKKGKPIETESQLLVALERFFTNVSERESIEDIHEELREYGYNPEVLGNRIEALAQRALADSQFNWKNKARREIQIAKTKLNRIESTAAIDRLDRPSLVNAIQQLLWKLGYRDNQLVPAHFRNFETASDQDLLSLLHELEYLTADQEDAEE
jgi:N-acetyl-anhydromuramyl-L-alanine amidase AmpD